jgi:hypothetical protein
MRFKGKLVVSGKTPDGKTWALASEAETFKFGSLEFSDRPPAWSGPVHAHTTDSVTMKTSKPKEWSSIPDDYQNFALVMDCNCQTGYPINKIEENRISLSRFPLMTATHCTVPSFDYQLKNAIKN